MVAYTVARRFVPLVASGCVTAMIQPRRSARGRTAVMGERIELLAEAEPGNRVRIVDPDPVVVVAQSVFVDQSSLTGAPSGRAVECITDRSLLDAVARAVGFSSWRELPGFFAKPDELPLEATLIRWELQ